MPVHRVEENGILRINGAGSEGPGYGSQTGGLIFESLLISNTEG